MLRQEEKSSERTNVSGERETDGRVIDVNGQVAVEWNVDRNETNAVDRRENAEKLVSFSSF